MALMRRALPETLRISMSRRLSRETRERLFAQQFRGQSQLANDKSVCDSFDLHGFLRVNLRGGNPKVSSNPARNTKHSYKVLRRIFAN